MLWLAYILCTGLIIYSGTKLSKYGDIIAEKLQLGRVWIGMVLLATVTSIPELVTGISSVTIADVPDIAVGNVLGSCVFNMLILAGLDAIRPEPISSRAHFGHILSAGFAILLLSITIMGLFIGKYFYPVDWIGSYSFLIMLLYFTSIKTVYSFERKQISEFVKEVALELKYEKVSMRKALLKFSVNALLVVLAALVLPEVGERLAIETGLGQIFVGNILIAFSTALPEMVVSVSAVKMGAVDLAIGNLFGSIIFNIFILAVDDVFFIKGPLLSFVDQNHIVSGVSALAMTSIAVVGLTYRASRKRLLLSWHSFGIIAVYVFNLILLYQLR